MPWTAPTPRSAIPITASTSNQTPIIENHVSALEAAKFEYDVYATPFVPSVLKNINREQGQVSNNEPKHTIDYASYTDSFAGRSFVPKRQIPAYFDQQHYTYELSPENYFGFFKQLFQNERAAKEKENELYALYKVSMKHIPTSEGTLFLLTIPGLREDTPLVEMGDVLHVRQLIVHNDGNLSPGRNWTGIQHNASVFAVNRAQELVYLKADAIIPVSHTHQIPAVVANVVVPVKERDLTAQMNALAVVQGALRSTSTEKVLDRLENLGSGDTTDPKKANGLAVHENNWIRKMLFPQETDGIQMHTLRGIPHRQLFDHNINFEQAHAVNSVCKNDYGVLPYLISGPPGTGKTKTLVEMAMQLLQTTDVAHMLICAPSEPAADTLALRLKEYLDRAQLLRLNRPNRADNEREMFYIPPFEVLMKYNVVVTSCRARVTNADLYAIERNTMAAFHPESLSAPRELHWGALLIDEAAQATEMDVLPAISAIMPPPDYPSHLPQPRFALAGDEHQLGPRTASRDPLYSTSLFARLFARTLYATHPLSRTLIKPSTGPPVLTKSMLPILTPPFTNLTRNYRSHPAIPSVPSSLFYADTLLPEAPLSRTPLQHSTLWRGRKWPLLFIPHIGPDEIEREGGGWYNESEARTACSLAQRLVRESAVRQADICIMSPFAAQVRLLRRHMRSAAYGGLYDVNIGPLEAFQGLERRVVIVCTTRTRARFLELDRRLGMGVLGQRRRMNVAVTRAMEGLFVIGSPEVLGGDEWWGEWLAFCVRNGVLGGGDAGVGFGGEYEEWVEGLREVFDEDDGQEMEA
ncbi:P-loop containing nucleoside triphosphate hydrolase protein [Corynespora cassiicola Philippines]|uniref:P-loop containing nucleoside triphosphate hydrolase protein n=1 Tax=Corynespora cassiicola Philippines TaxID=1448308 RepID=A0A2T2P7W4_CORCC|nr:P-loop containing nucleoside triphosphate hydrolase protein [Corynespora cassiicola Philippines]